MLQREPKQQSYRSQQVVYLYEIDTEIDTSYAQPF